jgi:hypothetical protein
MGFGYGHDAVSELAIFMPISPQSGGFYTDASSMRFLYVSCFKDIKKGREVCQEGDYQMQKKEAGVARKALADA